MQLASQTAGIDEVAAALGRDAGWLRRNWLRIHETAGFPRKHPTGWTWPREAVAAWLRGEHGGAVPQAGNDNAGRADDAYAAALADRYGGAS